MSGFDIIAFLEEYERFPCLWQKKCSDFKNRVKRDNAEYILLSITGLPYVKALRQKIRSIRGTYNQEWTKVKKSKITGSGADDVYHPKLLWFEYADRFLRQNAEENETESNLILNEKETEIENGEFGEDNQQPLPSSVGVATPSGRPFHKPKKQKVDDALDNALEALKKVAARPQSALNELSSFGQRTAAQLNCLPLEQSILLQDEIQKLITAARLRNLRDTNSPGIIPTESSSASSTVCSDSPCTPHVQYLEEEHSDEKIMTYFKNWEGEE